MVESLRELNKVCQKPRYREVGNWMVRHILRDAALPVTWVLLHTRTTANQVTLVSLLAGLAGIACLAFQGHACYLWGVAGIQLWYFLDHVDGQLARYYKTASLTGRFYDFMVHHIIHGALFFALGWYATSRWEQPFWIFWGFVVSLAMIAFNLLQDARAKTYYERFLSQKKITVLSSPEIDKPGKKTFTHPVKSIFFILHKSVEIHVAMNILTLAALLELFLPENIDTRLILFLFYAAAVPVLTGAKWTYLVLTRQIDRDYATRFREEG